MRIKERERQRLDDYGDDFSLVYWLAGIFAAFLAIGFAIIYFS